MIELLIHAETVIKFVMSIEQLGEFRAEFIDGKRAVGFVILHRSVNAFATAKPRFHLEIARPDKQRVWLLRTWINDGDSIRLGKFRQVEKIGILPEFILGIVTAGRLVRRRDDRYRIFAARLNALLQLCSHMTKVYPNGKTAKSCSCLFWVFL